MTGSRVPLRPMREALAWLAGVAGGVVVPLFAGAAWILAVVRGSLAGAAVALAVWPVAGGILVWTWKRRADPAAVAEWRLFRTLSICAFAVGTAAAAAVAVILS